MEETLKLLAILAHPDDESLGAGSTLAKYSAEGVDTYLICATKGQRGWTGDEKDNPGLEKLGKIREAELLEAAKILGIKKVYFLGYMDGDLDQVDTPEVNQKIAGIIREVRPDVAFSFGPDGAYGHPDHIAISQFALSASVVAADSEFIDSKKLPPHVVKKFYYFMNAAEIIKNYSRVFGNIEMEIDGTKRSFIQFPDWILTTVIDGAAYWKTALRAVNCHKSQVSIYGDLNLLSEPRSVELWGKRTYYRVYSLVNSGRNMETDLFAGIR